MYCLSDVFLPELGMGLDMYPLTFNEIFLISPKWSKSMVEELGLVLSVAVITDTSETAANELNASPRNPNVGTDSKSSKVVSFDVQLFLPKQIHASNINHKRC
ncbi:hypothetical protein AYI68_g2753 [Smittium mucronatum]|uniref:Uncharacterized protein n=1 Tax=Smittium mucronatum TaxID=133383 RepID=A0A1R0H1V0_9FUNG|nr:hypothetical protein AYI68_g2753 [Smittium mucronatum]